jgi:hypothetical protein
LLLLLLLRRILLLGLLLQLLPAGISSHGADRRWPLPPVLAYVWHLDA